MRSAGPGRARRSAMLGAVAAAVALAFLAAVSSAAAQSTTTKAVTSKKTSTATRVTVQNTHRINLPCKAGTYKFTEGGSLAIYEDQFKEGTTEFLASWNSLGKNVVANKDQSVDLKLLRPATTYEKTGRYQGAGAVLTHRRRLPYGRVTAWVRAGPRNGPGVVMSLITMSPRGDEIDFEWVLGSSATPNQVQYTWYRGQIPNTVPNYWGRGGNCGPRNGQRLSQTFHKYTFDWNRQRIIWLLDDVECYRVNRNDWYGTLPNGTRYLMFPDEPSNIQVGIWDGGGPANLKGTIDWSGGPSRWDIPSVAKNGYGLTVANITVACGPQR